MYLEILRMRNKKFDAEKIRSKYSIDDETKDETVTELFEISPVEPHQFYEVIEHAESENVSDLLEISTFSEVSEQTHIQVVPGSINKSLIMPRNLTKSQETPLNLNDILENSIKISESYKKVERPQKPIILNPTIIVKKIVHTRIKLFRCDLCLHTISTKTAMERHMLQIHLKKSPKSGFFCKVCSKTFAKAAILRVHEKIHLICRASHDCPHCAKSLSSQTAVANHIKWMHAEKEFQCKVCAKKFATVSKKPSKR